MPPAIRHAGAALLSRRALGLAIVCGGAVLVLEGLWQGVVRADPRVGQALLAGLVAAGATALGTLPVALALRTTDRARDTMLGFGAGVMLAACAFSLIVPALAASQVQGFGRGASAGIVGVGLLLGAALLLALDRWLPHEHFIKGREGGHLLQEARHLKRTWLFVFAVSLHNLPEGLAIGAAYGGSDPLRASALATGIAIQDVPEGLVIALALVTANYRRSFAVAIGALSGLVEPIGALFGAAVVTASNAMLPWGLAIAAGAMLFVISHEIIPESHRQGHERWATCGLLLGFVLMMGLDTALG